MPMFARLMTTIVHSTQTLKPRFSAKIEKMRFLRAIFLPDDSQNASSSGSQLLDPAAARQQRRRLPGGASTASGVVDRRAHVSSEALVTTANLPERDFGPVS